MLVTRTAWHYAAVSGGDVQRRCSTCAVSLTEMWFGRRKSQSFEVIPQNLLDRFHGSQNTPKMNKQVNGPVCLLFIALFFFCTACGSRHLKRGDDWLKMQDYTQAATEFSQAVAEDPANVEAHVGLIKSLIGLGRYELAATEIDVVRRYEPSRAVELTKLTEDSLLNLFNSPNSRMSVFDAMNKLDLLRTIGSVRSVPLLKSLMGNSSAELADKAESILRVLAPSEVEPTLDALLDSSDIGVQSRTAKRLWQVKRSEKAGRVLLAAAEAEVTSACKNTSVQLSPEAKQALNKGLQDLDALGYGLAKDFYRQVITTANAYNWELITACINRIKAANDSGMKDAVVGMMRNNYLGDVSKLVGYSPPQEALDFLASIGDKTFVPELKAALSYYISDFYASQRYCPAIQSLLSQMDGKKWASFHYIDTFGGHTDQDNILWSIKALGEQKNISDSPVVDNTPEDAGSIGSFAPLLGGDSLKVNSVEVVDADRMKWTCSIYEGDSNNMLWELNIIFRGTGLVEHPWLITRVDNVRQKAQKIGGNAFAFLRSGKAKLEKQDYDGAIDDFSRGLRWRPNSNDLHRNRGWAECFKGEYDSAIADAEQACAVNTYDEEAQLLYGYAKLRKGDYDGAIAQFDRMISQGMQKATAYSWRATAEEKKGDLDGAIGDYRRAIDMDPKLKGELLPKIESAKAKRDRIGRP